MNEQEKTTTTWWRVYIDYNQVPTVSAVEVIKETAKTLVLRKEASWQTEGYYEYRVSKGSESSIYFDTEFQAHQYSMKLLERQRSKYQEILDEVNDLLKRSSNFVAKHSIPLSESTES